MIHNRLKQLFTTLLLLCCTVVSAQQDYGTSTMDPDCNGADVARQQRYIETLTTTGGITNINYSASGPVQDGTQYANALDHVLQVRQGQEGVSLTLKCADEEDGLKWCYLYGWIDFNGNKEFEESERIITAGTKERATPEFQTGVTFNFNIPADAIPCDTRMRLVFGDAWFTVPQPTGLHNKGFSIDFSVAINGYCGDNALWKVDTSTNTLTVYGNGDMYDYELNSMQWGNIKDNINNVVVEDGITYIGHHAFSNFENLESVSIAGSVTTIGTYAFMSCDNLVNVNLEEGITTLVQGTFYGCSALNSIELPNSITYIGMETFEWCSGLRSIEIPNNVERIESEAFLSCLSLESITIPSGVTYIGEMVLSGCGQLTSIVVDEGNSYYDSRDNCNAIIETATNKLINGCKNTVIPYGVTTIGVEAFVGCEFYNIEIPNSVTTIETRAFSECYALQSLEIPASVQHIGENAFNGNSNLTSIVVDENNSYYDSRENCNALIETATNTLIEGCGSTVIPSSVTSIATSAFSNNRHITSIVIPGSVTSIGDFAFNSCGSLANIVIQDGVQHIGNYAFSYCYNLTSITSYIPAEDLFAIDANIFESIDKDNCTLYVPTGAKATYEATEGWNQFTNIVEVFLQNSGECGENASWSFDQATGVLTISGEGAMSDYDSDYYSGNYYFAPWYPIKENITAIVIEEGITAIGDCAFFELDKVESVTIPNGVTSIGNNAFRDLFALSQLTLPEGVEILEDNAIRGCTTLVSIDIPESVKSIGENAFYDCWSLKSITIPSQVKRIEYFTFIYCHALENVTLPAGLEYIDPGAFTSTNLKTITSFIPADKLFALTTYYNESFVKGCTLYVPKGAADTYRQTIGWKDADNIIEIDGKCGDAAVYTFDEETATLTIFGEGAIYDYNDSGDSPWYGVINDIKSIDIESGITAIGDNAIRACTEATSIEIPNTVTKIGDYGIYQLWNLQSLTIPNSVTEVGEFAFATLVSIKEIHIPASLTSIGASAFGGCNSLETITVDSNNPSFNSNNNCNAIIETATNALVMGCKNTVIPDNVTKINKHAFTQLGIGPVATGGPTSITIPAGVTEIGEYAFSQCRNLETIISHIPADRLFTPGYQAFNDLHPNCTLYVPTGAKETYAATEGWNIFTDIVEFDGKCGNNIHWALDEATGTLTILGTGAMYDYNAGSSSTASTLAPWYSVKDNIRKVVIGEKITHIGVCAFDDCTQVTDIVFSNDIESIGEYAFADCAVESVEIPVSVTSIGRGVFAGCNNLAQLTVAVGNPSFISPEGSNVIIHNSTKTLVAGCKNSVIPTTIKIIGRSAFESLANLQNIAIPEGVTTIAEKAFYACDAVTSITLPASLEVIGQESFSNCDGFTTINIPANVTTIEDYAFRLCTGLKSVTIGNKVESIGVWAFHLCSNLETVTIGSSVSSIGSEAFAECPKISSITSQIPASTLPAINTNVFQGVDKSTCMLIVPSGAKSTYASKSGWSGFTNIVEPNVTTNNVTYEVISYTEKTARVKSVNASATSVNISTTVNICGVTFDVTSIHNNAFYGCYSLSDIKIEGFYENLTASMFSSTMPYREAYENSTPLYIDKYFFGIVNNWDDFSGDMNIAAGTKYIMSIGSYCSIRKLNIPASVEYIKYDGVKGGEYDSCYECEDYHWVSYPTGYNVDAGNSNFSSIDGVLYNKQQTELLQCAYGQEAAIVIPATVEKIRSNALATSSILPIECLATTPPVCESSLRLNSTQKVYVPQESIDSYLAADYWKECYLQPSFSAYSDEVKLYGQTLSDWRITETSYDVVSKTYNIDALKGEKLSFTFNIDTYDAYFKVYVDNVLRDGTWEREATGVFEHIFTSSGAHTLRLEYEAYDSYMEDKISVTNLTVARAAYKKHSVSLEDWTSDAIEHNQSSQKRYTFNADAGSTITFDWTTSTEVDYDILTCVLDNNTILTKSGVNNGTYTGTISRSGSHTLVCTYSKDYSVDNGSDQVSISNILIEKSISDYNHIDSFVLSEIGNNNNIVRFSDLRVDEFIYKRNFTNTNWQALYLPIEIPYEALAEEFEVAYPNDIHQYDDNDDGEIDRTELEIIKIKRGTLSADYPYLIRAKEADVKEISIEDATLYVGEENSYDCSSMHTQYIFTGTYSGVSGTELVNNRYYAMSNGALSYTNNLNAQLSPYRWYLKIVSRNGASQPQRISLVIGGEVTDIDEVECEEDTNVYYDLSGRRVENPTKGIYIVNGKKVFVK